MSKILRVNMTDRTATYEDVPEKYKFLAGRGLTSTVIYDEVDPTCHPLGPNNKLVFAPGIVTGTNAASSGRISVGAKSPLTGGIKESNAGTRWPQLVARLGIKAIVVEGYPEGAGWWGLHVTKDGVEFFPADEYVGGEEFDAVFGNVQPPPAVAFGVALDDDGLDPQSGDQLRPAGASVRLLDAAGEG